MRKLGERLLYIFLACTFLLSCSRNIVPGLTSVKKSQSYDSTAFDYIFIEALKQKLLGNDGDALKYLEQCLTINPESDAAYYQIAQIALKRGDINNGKIYSRAAVSIKEQNLWYLTQLANIYYQLKQPDSSLIYYGKALKYFPESECLRLTLGNILSENGEYKKAEEIYKYFEDKYGVNENTTIFLVKSLMSEGRFAEAGEKVKRLLEIDADEILYSGLLAEIYRGMGEKEKALEVYRNLMDKDPGNPRTLLSLSDFLISAKDYSDLPGLLNNIILNDKIGKEDKIALFAKIIENEDVLKNMYKETEIALLVLEATYKNDPIVMLLRPEFFLNINKADQAIMRLEELIKDTPENYYAWEKLMILYSEKPDYDKLFLVGKECATRFNRSYPAKILYASAAIEKGEFVVAGEELRKARILAGDQKELVVQIISMEADVYYRMKEYDKSFNAFKEALKLVPDDIIILNNYAYYLAEQGKDLAEAEKMAKAVISREENNGTYLDTYAWVLYKRGKIKEAVKIMELIIKEGNKEDADWCEHYGFMMKALKNCSAAKEYWNKAISLDPEKSNLKREIENCVK